MNVEFNRSIQERVFHAVLYELLANILVSLSLAWLMQIPLLHSGKLSLISAFIATIWNYTFNYIYDCAAVRYRFQRGFLCRVIHSFFFEAGLIIILIPVAMSILQLSLSGAIFVETGLVLFFLPYTLFYNLVYDYLRWAIVGPNVN